jgi:hypothetical protein
MKIRDRLDRLERTILPPPAQPVVIAGVPIEDLPALMERIAREGRHITETST